MRFSVSPHNFISYCYFDFLVAAILIGMKLFHFLAEITFHCMNITFCVFIHCLKTFGLFLPFWLLCNAAINVHVQIFVHVCFHFFYVDTFC